MKRIIFLVLGIAYLAIGWSCNSLSSTSTINGCPTVTTTGTIAISSSPMSLLLNVVPAESTKKIMYNNIPILSTYENVIIPGKQDLQGKKIEWWRSFEKSILYGYSFPTMTDFWGFDSVEIKGILTTWVDDSSILNILGGNLNTDTFLKKMKSYQYKEEDYLGYTILSGIPSFDDSPNRSQIMPRAFGIINDIQENGGFINSILIAEKREENLIAEEEINQAKSTIKMAIKAYYDKTSLGYRNEGMTSLANSLGEIGSVFISDISALPFQAIIDMRQQNIDQYKSFIGSGTLDKYQRIAVTLNKSSGEDLVTFILDYKTKEEAANNIEALRERLSTSKLSLQNKALTDYLDIQKVDIEGHYLKAVMRINQIQFNDSSRYSFIGSIWAGDYWFIYPGSSESLN